MNTFFKTNQTARRLAIAFARKLQQVTGRPNSYQTSAAGYFEQLLKRHSAHTIEQVMLWSLGLSTYRWACSTPRKFCFEFRRLLAAWQAQAPMTASDDPKALELAQALETARAWPVKTRRTLRSTVLMSCRNFRAFRQRLAAVANNAGAELSGELQSKGRVVDLGRRRLLCHLNDVISTDPYWFVESWILHHNGELLSADNATFQDEVLQYASIYCGRCVTWDELGLHEDPKEKQSRRTPAADSAHN